MAEYTVSFWESTHSKNSFDVIVIGAGFTGLYCSLFIKQTYPSLDILVVERSSLAHGASSKNAGFLCIGSPSELLANIDQIGEEQVENILYKRWSGMQYILSLFSPYDIDLQPTGGAEVFFSKDSRQFEHCQAHISQLNNIFQSATGITNNFTINQASKTIHSRSEYLLDPVKVLLQLQKIGRQMGIQYRFQTSVMEIQESKHNAEIVLDSGERLQSNTLVIACNGFTRRIVPDIDIQPARNIVLLSKPIPQIDTFTKAYHYDKGYMYWRRINNRLLIGGARNLDLAQETTEEFGTNEEIKDHLIQFVKSQLMVPNFQVDHEWSGILGITSTGMPIVNLALQPSNCLWWNEWHGCCNFSPFS